MACNNHNRRARARLQYMQSPYQPIISVWPCVIARPTEVYNQMRARLFCVEAQTSRESKRILRMIE